MDVKKIEFAIEQKFDQLHHSVVSMKLVVPIIFLIESMKVPMFLQKIKYKFRMFCKHSLFSVFSYVLRHQKLKNALVIIANKTQLRTILSSLYARVGTSITSSNGNVKSLYKEEELSLYAKDIYNQLTKKYLP
jgi:hypothetical protein